MVGNLLYGKLFSIESLNSTQQEIDSYFFVIFIIVFIRKSLFKINKVKKIIELICLPLRCWVDGQWTNIDQVYHLASFGGKINHRGHCLE